MSLLIQEPPLIVLPSLAREVGLPPAILLQQLYFAGQKAADGWVTRSTGDWSRALRGVIAPRTIERAFSKLLEADWVEASSSPGLPTAYRVTPARLAGVASASEAGEGPPQRRGSLSKRERQREGTPVSPSSKGEHPEFSEWVGHHHLTTGAAVPKAGTKARATVAAMFAARIEEGYSLAELKLATIGAWEDEWRRANGHTGCVSVLRPQKVHDLIVKGQAHEAKRQTGGTDWSRFDGD